MGMNVSTGGDDEEVISAINTTPLVDVMLVLLIIFLITIPVAIQVVPVRLPEQNNLALETKPENVNLSVTRGGRVYWNQEWLEDDALLARLKETATLQPQPEVHIRGDGGAPYEHIGRVVLACQRAGIAKVGFITEPPPRG
ncbi:MAG: biopolymer transporter ExbD [Azoarcus sp.]|jgi:biopolymer transport protein ExbD|nr:biopolymer transporter ExbD [Azoarcus sp.]